MSTVDQICQAVGVKLERATSSPHEANILTPGAVAFLLKLHERFEPTRQMLLQNRDKLQNELNQGKRLAFDPATSDVRAGDWTVAPIPADLQDRRVEITGPVDRKMVINALNSGAKVFMADFEDSNSPTWENDLSGQQNLLDANSGTISFTSPQGKVYQLVPHPAVLMVRPRGWHLLEGHFQVNGKAISASLFDFGLYFFHNADLRWKNGSGCYFYLPKLEHHLEARLWNDVFQFSQETLGLPQGSIRATVLIETLPAAFQMDEILYELRDHSAGLNCGRWDYIFSFIKKFHEDPRFVLPDRSQVGMDKHFLASYVKLLIQTCHRRGIHAMGGMAAQIPIKDDRVANDKAMEKVRGDKLREVTAGHDGTWVAHPGLIPVAMEIFDKHMPTPNQLNVEPEGQISASDLMQVPEGTRTETGLRQNIDVGVQYLAAWLCGNGCVPIYNLMEDAATAEISRSQVWQWIHHAAQLEDGTAVTSERVQQITREELAKIEERLGDKGYAEGRFALAGELFVGMMTAVNFENFLTLVAYPHLK
jgi:malate synthase